MKHIFKTVILACFLLKLLSCNEDKGNYDYVAVNSVDSINDVDNYVHEVGEILRVTPRLQFSEGEDESNFTFTYYYRDDSQDPAKWVILQEGRNLEIEVADPIGTPNKSYTLAYEIVNKKTEGAYRKIFYLTIVNSLSRGFLALCEHDNGFDIDMISQSSDRKFGLHKNILELTKSELPREGVKPYDILCFDDAFAPDPFAVVGGSYSMYILTDRYTTRLLPSDYSWKPSYDISNAIEKGSYLDREYVQKGNPVIAEQMQLAYVSVNGILRPRVLIYHKEPDATGNWYLYNTYMMMSLFSVQMNRVRPSGEPRYEPAPYVAAANNGVMYFDTDKNKFMYGSILSSSYYSRDLYYTQPIPEESTTLFKYSDPNEGLLYMGQIPDDRVAMDGYAILKQAGGSFKYIEFRSSIAVAGMATNAATKLRTSTIPASSNISNAKFFARAPVSTNSLYLYYVTNDNKVYKVDISGGMAVVADITSDILKGGGYDEITLFKFTLPESSKGEADVKKALAVGTYNSSLGKAEGGKLEFFQIDNPASGNLTLAKFPAEKPTDEGYQIDMTWTGLGRIVGLSYKQK